MASRRERDNKPERKLQRRIANRAWEKEQIKNGMCRCCTQPLKTKAHCEYHAEKAVNYARKHKAKTGKFTKDYDRERHAKINHGEYAECHILLMQIKDKIQRRMPCQN